MPKISKIYQISNKEFINIVKNAKSYSDCLRALGLTTRGGSSTDILKRRIKELNISIDHFSTVGIDYNVNGNKKQPIEDILIKNSTYANTTYLKKRLIDENILEYKCEKCGNKGEWMGIPLILQLDHINGDNKDNRIENLRILCPNCHSQTKTYSGRNK